MAFPKSNDNRLLYAALTAGGTALVLSKMQGRKITLASPPPSLPSPSGEGATAQSDVQATGVAEDAYFSAGMFVGVGSVVLAWIAFERFRTPASNWLSTRSQ